MDTGMWPETDWKWAYGLTKMADHNKRLQEISSDLNKLLEFCQKKIKTDPYLALGFLTGYMNSVSYGELSAFIELEPFLGSGSLG